MLTWIETIFILIGFIFCFVGGLCYGYETGKESRNGRNN